MSIKNGVYLDADNQPTLEFYDMVNDFEKRLAEATKNTSLPERQTLKN